MLFLDMLMALLILTIIIVQADTSSLPRIFLALLVASGGILVVHVTGRWLLDRFTIGWWRQDRWSLPERRRIYRSRTLRTRLEEKLEAMDDAELDAYVKKYPRDPRGTEIRAARLKHAGRWAEYAREVEYLLTLEHGMSVEEACRRYCELAEVYQERLGRPERAREMLHTLIATYPRHYQASLARQRLALLEEGNLID